MSDLKALIRNVADFPQRGILFRDISPLLREHFAATIAAMDTLLTEGEWSSIDAVAGIESRGFILGAALATHRGKGFVLVRKAGKLPPPVVARDYQLEYGTASMEMQRGAGRVLLVDDVFATGGTLRAAAHLCEESGHEIGALATLIDLQLVPALTWRDQLLRSVLRYG